MEGLRPGSYFGKRGVWYDRAEGSVEVEIMEVVMVVYVSETAENSLIVG